MNHWFLKFEEWLMKLFGYDFVVHFEDTILFTAGIFVGIIIMSFLAGIVVFKLQKVKNLGSNKVKLIKFKHCGVKQYIVDPQTIGESIETLLLVIFRPFFTTKEYDLRDEKRTKYFLIIMFALTVVLVVFALLSISTVFIDSTH